MILLALAALRTLTISNEDRWLDALLAAAILLTAAITRRRAPTSPPVFALAGLAAIAALQFATNLTVSRYDTFGAMLFWATLLAACYIAPAENTLHLSLVFAAIVALSVLLPSIAGLVGPFQSRNNAASFLLLFLPIALHRALTVEHNRTLPLALAALLSAAIFATGSRAGAALALAEILALMFLCRDGFRRAQAAPRRDREVALTTRFSEDGSERDLAIAPRAVTRNDKTALRSIATAGAVFVAGLISGGALFDRFREPNPLGYRREILASTWNMISDRPLAGFGFGSFESVYPAYATFDTGLRVNFAHNDWAQFTSEGGIAALICFVVLFGAALRAGWRKPWAIGLVALMLHALVDYPFARSGVALWFAILLGIASNNFPTSDN